ncbi:hypothetical protein M427DRAFT_45152 [Gonapodya prolifera JEL478]|uniref:Uncharacterized protein n=1 Tax=Gonapodya prolifera (strain JEL478) TaxID=1344416 RepID=A0A139ACM8_GONPJ|nr:hypothetical protein M427DRAFT_45152 [Gonapodya prolifera JEL478]|eukprot:KXS14334.1 hypothetical protein M427DRAFT_45152 [Gonapodya prolifera JEL478]
MAYANCTAESARATPSHTPFPPLDMGRPDETASTSKIRLLASDQLRSRHYATQITPDEDLEASSADRATERQSYKIPNMLPNLILCAIAAASVFFATGTSAMDDVYNAALATWQQDMVENVFNSTFYATPGIFLAPAPNRGRSSSWNESPERLWTESTRTRQG